MGAKLEIIDVMVLLAMSYNVHCAIRYNNWTALLGWLTAVVAYIGYIAAKGHVQ